MTDIKPGYNLAVIIVSYNVEALLRKCLKTLRGRLPEGNNAIVVVDNVSKDGSVEMVRREFPECVLVCEKRNTGFGRATNAGAKAVNAQHYLILNPDTEISNDIILRMSAHMKTHTEAGIVGCRMLTPKGEIQRFIYALPTLFSAISGILNLKRMLDVKAFAGLFDRLTWIPAFKEYLRPKEWQADWVRAGAVPGSCFLIEGELWRGLGGFDENIFLYNEDADLFCRVLHEGKKEIHLLRDTGVLHHVGKSFNSRFTEYSPYKHWSTLYYFRKNHGPVYGLLIALTLFLGALARLLFTYFTRFENAEVRGRYLRDCATVMKISLFGLKAFDPFSSVS